MTRIPLSDEVTEPDFDEVQVGPDDLDEDGDAYDYDDPDDDVLDEDFDETEEDMEIVDDGY